MTTSTELHGVLLELEVPRLKEMVYWSARSEGSTRQSAYIAGRFS